MNFIYIAQKDKKCCSAAKQHQEHKETRVQLFIHYPLKPEKGIFETISISCGFESGKLGVGSVSIDMAESLCLWLRHASNISNNFHSKKDISEINEKETNKTKKT